MLIGHHLSPSVTNQKILFYLFGTGRRCIQRDPRVPSPWGLQECGGLSSGLPKKVLSLSREVDDLKEAECLDLQFLFRNKRMLCWLDFLCSAHCFRESRRRSSPSRNPRSTSTARARSFKSDVAVLKQEGQWIKEDESPIQRSLKSFTQ